jgi:exopolyphosphatase / guanosine-5'-triphosphate,3'-diphosphate pyrophosphatase
MEPQRVAVVDLGTNSTRLLVAEVANGAVTALEQRTEVPRLGEGVDRNGRLSDEAIARVHETLGGYREVIERLGARRVVGVATSAVRDAENGEEFRQELAERFGIDASIISGEEEARLTFLGATSGRAERDDETMVLDIGGGSTEFVLGRPGSEPSFHVSATLGSVRHTERHLQSDPPKPDEIAELSADAQRTIEAEVPADLRERVHAGIAVAGTATSLAAIDLELDPYDPERVHGYELTLAASERMLARLAALRLEERRRVTGLKPDRAPTIVAGAVILVETMRAFGLDAMEISEADLLHGAALAAADSTDG